MRLKASNKNVYILFDKEFYPIIKEYTWHLDNYGYAVTTVWCKKTKKTGAHLKMHRLVTFFPKAHVDHINGNTLDNRLCNLRAASHAQNLWNGKVSSNNKLGLKGVVFVKRRNAYRAEICKHRKRFYLGQYKNKIDAATAYNEAAKILFENYANLNSGLPHNLVIRDKMIALLTKRF